MYVRMNQVESTMTLALEDFLSLPLTIILKTWIANISFILCTHGTHFKLPTTVFHC